MKIKELFFRWKAAIQVDKQRWKVEDESWVPRVSVDFI